MEEQRSEEKQHRCQEVGLAQGCGGEVTGVHWGGHGGAVEVVGVWWGGHGGAVGGRGGTVGRSQGCGGEVRGVRWGGHGAVTGRSQCWPL